MIYHNILTFLVAIFLFAIKNVPKYPWPSLPWGLLTLALLLGSFWVLIGVAINRLRPHSPNGYFATERLLTAGALIFYIIALNMVSVKYYLQPLSLGGYLPALPDIAGLGLFFLFLSLPWLRLRTAYLAIFRRPHGVWQFIGKNIKLNLPIVLPWVILTLTFDILRLLPFAPLRQILASSWASLVLNFLFVLFLVLFFPPLVRRLWDCRPLPASPLRRRIEAFCQTHGFKSEILLWPLYEGQILTAAVLGVLPKLRYLMITPALLATTTEMEMNAVLAHEIGHVKKHHLLLYVLLLLGFSTLMSQADAPLSYLIFHANLFYELIILTNLPPLGLFTFLWGTPVLAAFLIFFRFIFGYYIRNFERQADLQVFATMGTSLPLISAFEKIALLSGKIRHKKSWHHFGIGERIDFLQQCEGDRSLIHRHNQKIRNSLIGYLIALLTISWLAHLTPAKLFKADEVHLINNIFIASEETDHGTWLKLTGQLLLMRNQEEKAIAAYEKALRFDGNDPELLNNLAWLLMTAEDTALHDPLRALKLSRTAVDIQPQGEFYDTLAVAYQQNGLMEQAIANEKKALQLDPPNRDYYLSQLDKFRQEVQEKGEQTTNRSAWPD